jgi:DNA-binding MarR family transcriptional regulator
MKQDGKRPGAFQRVASQCIAVRVRLINRVVSAIYDEALRPHGLRVSQGNILVVVANKGSARPSEISRLLRLEKSTLSRDVEVMKRNGWLESDPPEGGRNQSLRLTEAGVDLLAKTLPAWEAAQAEATRLLGDDGVAAIRQMAADLSSKLLEA